MAVSAERGAGLVSRAGRALSWSFASTVVGRLSTLGVGVVLTRLLGPREMGTFAVAMVALYATLSFNELGVSLAIVRWPGDPREIAPTVATISVGASVAVFAGCYLGAPAFATLMGDQRATPVVRLLALCVIISGVVATPVALLQREFRQGRKMIADQVTTWAGAAGSLGCAIAGLGAMSLAIGQITGAVAGAILFVGFEPSGLRLGFDPAKARELLRFGLPLAGSSVVVFAVANVDKLLVGALLGPVPLAYYVLAANLANWPVSVLSVPVRSVAPALLARLRGDPAAMRATFVSAAGLLCAVAMPACALLAATAPPLVRLVYGPVWQPAAAVLLWLGPLAAARILFELAYDYFVVLASTRVVLAVQVLWLLALAPAVLLGAGLAGPVGAGAAQLAVGLLVVLPLYLRELRGTGVNLVELAASAALPAAVAAGVGLAAIVITRLVPGDVLAVLVAGLVGAAGTAALWYRLRAVPGKLRATASGAE